MADLPAFAVSNLSAGYNGTAVIADVTLSLSLGEVLGLLGANGAGKSTFLRALTGQLRPLGGSVAIAGTDMLAAPERAKAGFGLAIEPTELPAPLSGRQYLELVASIRGADLSDPLISDALARLALAKWLDRPIAEYSFGTRAKISIVAALIGRPSLLILDESLNGLDPLAAWEVKRMLIDLAATGRHAVIVATHVVEIVPALCTRAVLLAEGRIAEHWNTSELVSFSTAPGGFEAEVMEALRAGVAPSGRGG